MMPRCRDSEWFWGYQGYPECRGPTRRTPEIPQKLKEAAMARWRKEGAAAKAEERPECLHTLTKRWGHSAGKGKKCL